MNKFARYFAAAVAACASFVSFAADTPPAGVTLVDLTGSGNGTASSMYASGWTDGSAATAFDNNFDNRSIYNSQTCDWRWTFNEPTVVNAFKIFAPKSDYWYYDKRMPKNFRLEAKNTADTDWTTLDTRSNETAAWNAKEGHYYECHNTTAYDTYRIISTGTIEGGSGYTQIAEIEFYCVPMFIVDNATMTAPVNGSATITGTAAGGSGTVKAVFSTPGASDVEVALGSFAENDPVNVTINATTAGLSLMKLYTMKLVCTSSQMGREVQIPGIFYFGAQAHATDMTKKFDISVGSDFAEVIGDATLVDVPVPVRLSTAIDGFDYNDFQMQDHSDLAFTDALGNELAYEVDTWDTTGTSIVWVKIPSLTASTVITCWYGGGLFINTPASVWNGYIGVWHMNGGSGTEIDVTGHGLNGTPTGTKLSEMTTSPTAIIGAARVNQTSSGKYNRLSVPSYNDFISNHSRFTLSGWFKSTNKSGYPRPLSRKSSYDQGTGWEIQYDNGSATKVAVRGSDGSKAVTLDGPDSTADWVYLTFVFNGTTETTYANGGTGKKSGTIVAVASRTDPMAIGNNINGSEQGWCGMYDEVRMYNGVMDDTRIAVDYFAMKHGDAFTYASVTSVDDTAPSIALPTVVRNNDGSFTISAEISKNAPAAGSVKCVIGANEYSMSGSGLGTYITTVSGLAIGTYTCQVKAESTGGTEVTRFQQTPFYAGDISITLGQDASENGLVPGYLTISRADTLFDLTVNFAVDSSSTAVADTSYVALTSPIVIPDGSSSVNLVITPKMDPATKVDTSVIVNLEPGLYGIDANAATAQLTIANLSTPDGYNTWVATTPGLASDDSNWSEGHAPLASESVLFDGRFSNAKCKWDTDATHTVAAWKQENDFTATVEFDTEFPTYASATFPLFTITGDCEILSGKWSHRGNYNNYIDGTSSAEKSTQKLSAKRWCLNASIGGDLTIAAGASIDVTGKGFGHQNNQNAGCYGGYAFDNAANAPYGSITEPFDPGMGCRSQGDQNSKRSAIGGGAVKLVVTGDVTLNGSIVALGNVDLNVPRSGGSGGSIWIDANQISGSGTINASACPPSGNYTSDLGVAIGSGGRVAVYTKSALALPRANLICSGSAYSGTSGSSKAKVGSAGTIYIKDPSLANGILRLRQDSSVATLTSAKTAVPLMDAVTTFDAIELDGRVILQVDADKTLNLPGGFASVTSSVTSEGINGISYRGGTLNIGSGNQTISNWMFEPVSNYTFAASLALSNYGGVGIIKRNICGTGDAPIPPRNVSFAVNGDMSIDGTSAIDVANVVGYTHYNGGKMAGWYGGWTTYYDGNGNASGAHQLTYGSVFNPLDHGSSPTRAFLAGGAVDVTIGGTLTLNGSRITASATSSDNTTDGAAPSTGGSINLTVGALAGSGSISANGANARYSYAGAGGGGRVAVKLTNANANFPNDISITAQGGYGYAFNAKATKLGSAGTVYIETAADNAKGGVIKIGNWTDHALSEFTSATIFPTTPIVAYNNGDAVADFKRASLVVTNNAIAEVSVPALRMERLDVATNSRLDLYGGNLTVKKARIGGAKVSIGKHNLAAGGESSDYPGLVNTGDTVGTLEVLASSTMVLLK